jgi:MFS family permease
MMAVSFVNASYPLWMAAIADDLGMDEALTGVLLSGPFWGMAFAILVAGSLADRWGYRTLFVAGSLVQSLSMLAVSYAPTASIALAGAFLGSFGTGVAQVLPTPVACALYPRSRTPVCNLLMSFNSVGAVLVFFLGMFLARWGGTWRQAFRIVAAMVMVYGFAFALLPLPAPLPRTVKRTPPHRLLKSRAFLLVLLGNGANAFALVGIGSWLAIYIVKVLGGTQSQGAMALVFYSLAGVVGNWLNAGFSRRWGPRALVVPGGILGGAGLAVAVAANHPMMAAAGFALMALGMIGLGAALIANAGDRFPDAGASMYSVIFSSGNMACAIAPLAIGVLATLWNSRAAMAVPGAGPAIAAVILMILLPRRRGASLSPAASEARP